MAYHVRQTVSEFIGKENETLLGLEDEIGVVWSQAEHSRQGK